jgi:hypothetical protein
MTDIRESFLYCLDLEKLRLKNLPNFIFLCGGTTILSETDGQPPRYKSMRKAILDVVTDDIPDFSSKIRLAEDYQDWHEHGAVKNLIDFELAIADMAGSIVLILEAPGAYAELGSFSVLDRLSEKLILVVNKKLIADDSYISLGPIKYLEDNSRIVLKFSWDVSYIVKGVDRDKIDTLLTSNTESLLAKARMIGGRISEESESILLKSPRVDLNRSGHICLVIGDLIYHFGALRISEIKGYLSDWFEIKGMSISTVRSYLYILKAFDFIDEVDVGDKYYIPTENNKGFIKYFYKESLVKETGFNNVSEVRSHMLGYYAENEGARFEAVMEGGI